ncbi:glycosyl transferase family 2 [Thiocapsa marina 5811]|uniref:Glycosyl transferase family 2 n=1 Tax=Thiocapsa marina 5811 TaxID=768671 RepID=F9UIJ2_9GAMM|nr:glycosyl transferase family 2 [Thiocapsa marina 5811]
MSDSPLVSAIMPVYNAEGFLGASIDSVLAQSYPAVELIVVDDGSTDRSLKIAEQRAAQDRRVEVLRQGNAGVGSARNAAIRQANGLFVAPIDADDLWHPDKLRKQVAAFDASGPLTGFVYCPAIIIDELGRPASRCFHGNRPRGIVWLQLFVNNFTGNASTPLFRTECLRELGGYDETLFTANAYGAEDWDLCLRVAARYEAAYVPECLVGYRRVSGSMSSGTRRMKRSYDAIARRLFDSDWPIPGRFRRYSESTIARYLASQAYRSGNLSEVLRWSALALFRDPPCILDRPFRSSILASMRDRYKLRDLSKERPEEQSPRHTGAPLHWPDVAKYNQPPNHSKNRLWRRLLSHRTEQMIRLQRSTPFPLHSNIGQPSISLSRPAV